jgi:hypothetical protein
MSPDYQAGDIVKVSRTIALTTVGRVTDTLYGRDVQSGHPVTFTANDGTAKVEMVKRAPRMNRGPKPEVGTVLKGRDVKRIWWKRGTIIVCVDAGDNSDVVLRSDGLWHSVSEPFTSFNFEDLNPDASFKLLHVA